MRFWTLRATGDVVLDHVLRVVGHGCLRFALAVRREAVLAGLGPRAVRSLKLQLQR